jgi:hypothetical protein
MQRRAQLALALALLLVLAPLAGASCGIQCLVATSPLPTHAAATPQQCVRASACCHSTGPAICSATQAPQEIAALLTSNITTADPAAIVVVTSLPRSPASRVIHRIDSAPPGSPQNVSPIPLRI